MCNVDWQLLTDWLVCAQNFILFQVKHTYTRHSKHINRKHRNSKHIVLYSDGVTEAENRNQEMYSEDRLITAIQSATKEKPLLEQVRSEIDTFIAGMPLTDDLSLIVFTIEWSDCGVYT